MAALPAAPGGIQGAVGYRYWTMSVSNLSEMVQTCSNAGVPLVVPETEIRPGVRIAIVTDPDGNWVEFLTKS
jgi:catechol 2,3-dioxygenase-like lactoylglutathione lyase family enzyme